jgi:NADH pyrophosphatase NudC (nudix superfamily)
MQPRQVFSKYDWLSKASEGEYRFCPHCAAPLEPALRGGSERPACPACGFVQFRNPLPGIVVLIEDEGRVLLGKRNGNYGQGLWGLPQGFIEHDEVYLTAAVREVKEETGLDVEIVSILSVISNFLAPGLHTLAITVLAYVVSGEARADDDLTELAWHPLEGPLPAMAFDADQHIIERYAATRLAGAPVDPRYAGGK